MTQKCLISNPATLVLKKEKPKSVTAEIKYSKAWSVFPRPSHY